MNGAARFLFGALLGVALGYAFVLLTHPGVSSKRSLPLAARWSDGPPNEQPQPLEEIAAS